MYYGCLFYWTRVKGDFGLGQIDRMWHAENRHFQVGRALLRHCDVIRWLIFMILASMERLETLPYIMVQRTILWACQFHIHRAGGANHPLRKTYKKRLRKTNTDVKKGLLFQHTVILPKVILCIVAICFFCLFVFCLFVFFVSDSNILNFRLEEPYDCL